MTHPSDPTHLTGRCYCGGITFEVDLPAGAAPLFTAYCHCDSCRRAHAAPLYQVVCIDAAAFQITSGAELLVEFQKPGGRICRDFCGACGSRIKNRFPGWRPGGRVPLAFFPDLLDEDIRRDLPAPLRAARHNSPGDCVLEPELLRQVLDPS